MILKTELLSLTVACLLPLSLVAADKPVELTTAKERASYAVGSTIAGNLKSQGLDLDAKALLAGVRDTLAGKPILSKQELQQAMQELQSTLAASQQAAGAENLKAGEAFLTENREKEGVQITTSGLQYKVIVASEDNEAARPKASDSVKVHYHGTLIDGTVFDSSVDRGEPVSFEVGRVIAGWTEALQLMRVGEKWQLFIPSKLAYGERSPGGPIGPNSTLIFEVELLGIE